ncbi:class I SAM-dependent methyltransferase [Sediminibacillus albus]|uniref:Methyltransferase domain-containing protein n=1 Tax=Sediminibacillus albus TaxID=407036 RepID=A0A1G8YK70_9BACI|nr:methyltransferase domain-containing protein [Sediminibacillus albus]SDK03259.1 Methyltransferase domain-containing protein [Sediminibacillus albus]
MEKLESALIESWEVNGEAWIETIKGNKIESRNLSTKKAIIDNVLAYSPKKVLDMGCGEGWLARSLTSRGMDTVGIDGSQKLIQTAEEQGSGTFHLLTYDQFINNPKSIGESYDVVVFNFSLLSENITQILKACSQIMDSDGTIIIQTVHPFNSQSSNYKSGWREEDFSTMGDDYVRSMPWYFRTISSWIDVINESGYGLYACKEPIHPETGQPLSLILTMKLK